MSLNQLENIDLAHMVEDGRFIGAINAHLTPTQMYSMAGRWSPVPHRIGENHKINESQVAEPDQDDVTPVNIESRTVRDYFNNGVDPEYQKHGYFYLNMKKWSAKTEVLEDDAALAFADIWEPATKFIGEKAGMTLNLQSRRCLTQAYFGGNTYSKTVSASPVTDIDVADINGFKTVYELGIPFPVSGSHPLSVTITNTVLGEVVRNVTAAVEDERDNDSDEISGTLTISASIAQIAVGDNILSSQAPPHIAPNGKSSAYDIEADDTIDLTSVFSVLAALLSFNNSPMADGSFHFIGDVNHIPQFWEDTKFANAVQGQYGSQVYKDGMPLKLGNITFHFDSRPARSENADGVMVRRALILAEGALARGYYEKDPTQTYGKYTGNHDKMYDAVNKIHYVIAHPRDDLGERMTFSYKAYQGFAARTAHLAQFGNNPTAPYKMGVGLLTA